MAQSGGCLLAAPLLVGPQLLRADHARVEETGLVEGVALTVLCGLLRDLVLGVLSLVRVVGALLRVVALVGVGVGLLVAVRILLARVLLLIAGIRVRGLLLVAVGRLYGLLVVLVLRRYGGLLGRRRLGRRGVLLRERGEVGEIVGVAGVLDGAGVVGEGAEVVAGDTAVQLLPPRPTASRVLARTASKAPSLMST